MIQWKRLRQNLWNVIIKGLELRNWNILSILFKYGKQCVFYTVSARQGPLPGEGVDQTITIFSSSHKASVSLGSVVIFRAPNLPIKRRRENFTPPLPPSVKRGKLYISLMVFHPTYIFNENKCNHHSVFIPD